jgi:hypothetical protein
MTQPKEPFLVVVKSDIHCGSAQAVSSTPKNNTQKALLRRWKETKEFIGRRPDLMVINGDAPDGQDKKGMSIEDTDVPRQIEDAFNLIMMYEPKRVVIVEGSAYHTGDTVQQEKFLAGYIAKAGVQCEFTTKFRARINGWFKFQARHKIGRSDVPYGQHTAPSRSMAHQVINAALEARVSKKPISWPHLSVFSHVHYWSFAETAKGAVVTTPCWKSIGDRYGDTQCDGHIDIGTFWFEVGNTEKEGWSWNKRLYPARVEHHTVEL